MMVTIGVAPLTTAAEITVHTMLAGLGRITIRATPDVNKVATIRLVMSDRLADKT
jgi:hypothetical protein